MRKTPVELVAEALKEKKCIGDRLYFLAWCFSYEGLSPKHPDFHSRVLRWYKFFLSHSDPFTLERERERYLKEHPSIVDTAEDTSYLRALIKTGQLPLMSQEKQEEVPKEAPKEEEAKEPKIESVFDIGRRHLEIIKKTLEKRVDSEAGQPSSGDCPF